MSDLQLIAIEISLSEVISVIAGLLGGGPEMILAVVEPFALGVASLTPGATALHRVMSLVLCSEILHRASLRV